MGGRDAGNMIRIITVCEDTVCRGYGVPLEASHYCAAAFFCVAHTGSGRRCDCHGGFLLRWVPATGTVRGVQRAPRPRSNSRTRTHTHIHTCIAASHQPQPSSPMLPPLAGWRGHRNCTVQTAAPAEERSLFQRDAALCDSTLYQRGALPYRHVSPSFSWYHPR